MTFSPKKIYFSPVPGKVVYIGEYHFEISELFRISSKHHMPDAGVARSYLSAMHSGSPWLALDIVVAESDTSRGDRLELAKRLHNEGSEFYKQARYAEAEPLYKKSLAIKEEVLGLDHLSVARTLSNLANLYLAQGRYSEAEPLIARAKGIRTKHAPQ